MIYGIDESCTEMGMAAVLASAGCSDLVVATKKGGLTRVEAAQQLGIDEMLIGAYEWALVSPPMRVIAEMLRLYHADERIILLFCSLSFVPPKIRRSWPITGTH